MKIELTSKEESALLKIGDKVDLLRDRLDHLYFSAWEVITEGVGVRPHTWEIEESLLKYKGSTGQSLVLWAQSERQEIMKEENILRIRAQMKAAGITKDEL